MVRRNTWKTPWYPTYAIAVFIIKNEKWDGIVVRLDCCYLMVRGLQGWIFRGPKVPRGGGYITPTYIMTVFRFKNERWDGK